MLSPSEWMSSEVQNTHTNSVSVGSPDNNNRVKLLSEPGMPGSDYINASFISVSFPGSLAANLGGS